MDLVVRNDILGLNITWNGQNGELPDPIPEDASDADILRMALEAVRTGGVPGIDPDPRADFTDYVIKRYPAANGRPYGMAVLRPESPFGGKP